MTVFPIGRPRFVSIENALAWHAIAVYQYGGSHGIRDQAGLESALAMPRQSIGGEFAHEYPFGMAAAYAFHVVKNHPFTDGNKRAALACCAAFLRMNGWNLDSEGVRAADAILDLVENRLDKAGFADWLAQHCRERPRLELRDFFSAVTYLQIAEILRSGIVDPDPARSHAGRTSSILEAASAIPAIHQANIGAAMAAVAGDTKSATVLHGQSHLLTALHRLAEDMGYEW